MISNTVQLDLVRPRVCEPGDVRAGGEWIEPAARSQAALRETWSLQPFLWATDDDAASLYARRKTGPDFQGAEDLTSNPAGGILSFDTYFNSFYEAYWVAYTPIRKLALVVAGKGQCWCSIRREHSDGSSSTVRTGRLDLRDGERHAIDIDLKTGADAGRLFVEFGAIEQMFVLREASWATASAPKRKVRLGLALCTFNREGFLADTLDRLLHAPAEANIDRIIVVNHGAPFSGPDPKRSQIEADHRVEFIRQDNFGGAGGFTRGAMELLQDPAISHVLFMDDDIKLDPAHIVTAAAFAAFARDDLIVGGQMLDLFKPWMMFEAGACVTPQNLLRANHRELSLDRHANLKGLADVTACDFNAWWFSLIPAEAFRRHGLPTPVFIRGDDQEFGIRLADGGVPTVSLPPVSVWHEPFYAKPPGWQLYYDLRNRLIFASLYPDRVRLDGPAQLMKRLLAMMIRYDYQQARSIAIAVADFTRGPALISEPEPDIHRRVLKALGRHAQADVKTSHGLPLGDEDHPRDRSGGRRRLAASFARVLLGRPRANVAGGRCRFYARMPLDLMRLGRSYVLSDDGDHFALEFEYSVWKTWIRLLETTISIARYAFVRRRVAAEWKKAMPALRSFESWAARLNTEKGGSRS